MDSMEKNEELTKLLNEYTGEDYILPKKVVKQVEPVYTHSKFNEFTKMNKIADRIYYSFIGITCLTIIYICLRIFY